MASLTNIAAKLSGLEVIFDNIGKKASDSIGLFTTALTQSANPLVLFQGGLTKVATSMVDTISSVVGSTKGFVEALSPGTLLIFNQALRDLRATIGFAFEPIFQILATTFRKVAGIILPLMEQLRPVIASVTEVFSTVFLAVIRVIVAQLTAWIPVIQFLVGVVGEIAKFIEILSIILKTFYQTIAAFIGSLFGNFTVKDALKSLSDVVNKVINVLLKLVASLLVFFNLTNALKNLYTNLLPGAEKERGKDAAPTGGGVKGVEQIAKDIAQAAFVASGGGKTDAEKQLTVAQETLEWIKKLIDEPKYASKLIDEFIAKLIEELRKLYEKLKTTAVQGIGDAEDWASGGLLTKIGEALGNLGLAF